MSLRQVKSLSIPNRSWNHLRIFSVSMNSNSARVLRASSHLSAFTGRLNLQILMNMANCSRATMFHRYLRPTAKARFNPRWPREKATSAVYKNDSRLSNSASSSSVIYFGTRRSTSSFWSRGAKLLSSMKIWSYKKSISRRSGSKELTVMDWGCVNSIWMSMAVLVDLVTSYRAILTLDSSSS